MDPKITRFRVEEYSFTVEENPGKKFFIRVKPDDVKEDVCKIILSSDGDVYHLPLQVLKTVIKSIFEKELFKYVYIHHLGKSIIIHKYDNIAEALMEFQITICEESKN